MLFGRAPFGRLWDIINVRYSLTADKFTVSASAQDLIKRIFTRDPAQRITIPRTSSCYISSPPPLYFEITSLLHCRNCRTSVGARHLHRLAARP